MFDKIFGNSLIIISVALGALGQILMKNGMAKIGPLKNSNFLNGVLYFVKAIFSPLVFLGLFSYGISMIIWLWVLSKFDLSYARPFVSLGYIFIILYSLFVLKENIQITRWVGLLFILVGIFFVAKS